MKKFLLLLSLIYIVHLNGQTITTIAGNGSSTFSGDSGQAIFAGLGSPWGISFDNLGNLYITDGFHHRIRKVNVSGIITTIAGNGTTTFSGDGGQAINAGIPAPAGLAFDSLGNMYISDLNNNRLRQVSTSGVINTIAGNGTAAYGGDGGLATASELFYPVGITIDAIGNIYIADFYNNRIRMINTSGIINTIAGNGTAGFSGDGGLANNAEVNNPTGIAIDAVGNLYIADKGNQRIRMVNTAGIINTIAGNGTTGYGGDGGPAINAALNGPVAIVLDVSGNLYVADNNNNRVRKVNTSGVINTIAGNGTAGFNGDGGLAVSAELKGPGEMTFDMSGNLYIADNDNNRVRMITNVAAVTQFAVNAAQFITYPNPTKDQFFIDANTTDKLNVDLYDANGRRVFNASISDKSNINVTTLNEGIYTLTVKTAHRVINKKLVILR